MITGSILGILTGILTSLIPGLHTGLALALLLACGIQSIFGADFAIAFVATAAGTSLYTRRLAGVYHPSAGSGNVASLDPALALTAEGRGPDALKIMIMGTDAAWPVMGLVAFVLIFAGIGHVNIATELNKALSWLGLVIIGVWMAVIVQRSENKFAGAFGLAAIGLLGYIVLHHPGLRGNEHAMAPLMSGLFGIPIMLTVLRERIVSDLPEQNPSPVLKLNPLQSMLGAILGALTGFLAGLGAGSLAAMTASEDITHEDYLLLSSSAESTNDIMALLLVLAAGMGRSGEAVLLGRVAGQPSAFQVAIVIGLVVFAAFIGRKATFVLEPVYDKLIRLFPAQFWALLVLCLAIGQVLLTGNVLLGLALTFAGVCLSLWARSCKLPLQVSFAGIAVPVLLTSTGLAPMLNKLVFGI